MEGIMKPRFTLSWLLVVIAALGFMAFAQSRHALTFDDLAAIKRIADAQISPTGERVAYVVNAINKEQNRGKRSIWVVSTAGGTPQPMITFEKNDDPPRWSPDGNSIASLSAPNGEPPI